MTRLFVVLKIPESAVEQIIRVRKKVVEYSEEFNWEKKEKIHLTLKFIGHIPDEKIDLISKSLDFIKNYPKFKLSFTHFGFFLKNGKPNILWAGLSENKNLLKLVSEINNKLKIFSIPAEDRKFKSHLTLLRIKSKVSKDFISKFENYKMPEINFFSTESALMKSDLLPESSVYTEIKNYKLK